MSVVTHFAPRAIALVSWTLALTVAVGVSTPRLRAPGRERTARAGIARAGSQRPDDPRGWVAPGAEHDPDYTVAADVIGPQHGDHDGDVAPGGNRAVVPMLAMAAPPSSFAPIRPDPPAPRSSRWDARRASGRAPPLT